LAPKQSQPRHLTGICLLFACLAVADSVAADSGDVTVTATVPSPNAGFHPGTDSDAEALDVALWSAAADGDLGRFERLLAEGAEAQSRYAAAPTSALWIASQQGHTEIVKRLLALGTNVEAEDPSDGRTALFQAAQEGHAGIVSLLLEHGARVDVTSARTGATPLFTAAARGHIDVVRLLLAAGADVNVVATANGISDSPLSIARKRGFSGIIALIERSGGAGPRPEAQPRP
jgi:uncharacterized protein